MLFTKLLKGLKALFGFPFYIYKVYQSQIRCEKQQADDFLLTKKNLFRIEKEIDLFKMVEYVKDNHFTPPINKNTANLNCPSSKTCFISVYNHPHFANVAKIEQLYQKRFPDIYHLMPFVNRNVLPANSNIISVYNSSHLFHSYYAQGFQTYFRAEYDYYIFCQDDLILNPKICADNLQEYMGNADFGTVNLTNLVIASNNWFSTEDYLLHPITKFSPWSKAWEFLPSFEKAMNQAAKFGFSEKDLQIGKETKLEYPFIYDFSDIVIVSKAKIFDFIHYLGLFASLGIHVEVAIPTTIMLLNDNIKYIPFKCCKLNPNQLNVFEWSLKKLFANFPTDTDAIHPIKLSQWSFDI